jgi:chromosome segregation ATPase
LADNIDLLFETEQAHIGLNAHYSDLKASYEKLKQSADRISKSNIEVTSKLEKLSKDNKNVLERYDVKVAELTDIIEQDEKEIARLNKEHNSSIRQYESDIEDLKDSIKSYEKTINELNVFKDEQETVYGSLNETIKNQKLEILSMKNQNILQKTHENNIMESYNEQLSRNDELTKENKNLKLNVYDHENSIELLKSKLDAISNHNVNLIENENEQSRITKEQYSLITELRNEKEDFENKYTKLKSSLNEEYIPLEEHKSILLKYKEELKNLVDENTEYGISESAYREGIKQYNDEIEHLNITVNNSKTAYNLLQQRLQEIQRKESTLKASLKKVENESEHAKYEVVTLREELSSKTRIMDDMMGDKESLQDIMVRLENSKKENERLQKELENIESEKENVFAYYESQKEALSKLNILCDEQRDNISSLKDTLKTSNDSLKVVSQRVDELVQEKKVSDEKHLVVLSELKNNFVVERASMKDLERDLNEAVQQRDTKIRVLEKELYTVKEEFENKNNILKEFKISSDKNKEKQENLNKNIEEYEIKIKNLEFEINNFAVKEQQLHDEINELEQEKKSYGSRLADAINAEREKAKENMVMIKEDSEALKKLEKKVEVQSSLIQKLRDSEKALRDNDTLMQEDIKNMVSEKESLREEVSKLKQLNTTFISRVKKNNNEKQELEQSCETLKSTIIEYVETVKKMSKNEYDHAYLRNQIHHQEKNFAAFI